MGTIKVEQPRPVCKLNEGIFDQLISSSKIPEKEKKALELIKEEELVVFKTFEEKLLHLVDKIDILKKNDLEDTKIYKAIYKEKEQTCSSLLESFNLAFIDETRKGKILKIKILRDNLKKSLDSCLDRLKNDTEIMQEFKLVLYARSIAMKSELFLVLEYFTNNLDKIENGEMITSLVETLQNLKLEDYDPRVSKENIELKTNDNDFITGIRTEDNGYAVKINKIDQINSTINLPFSLEKVDTNKAQNENVDYRNLKKINLKLLREMDANLYETVIKLEDDKDKVKKLHSILNLLIDYNYKLPSHPLKHSEALIHVIYNLLLAYGEKTKHEVRLINKGTIDLSKNKSYGETIQLLNQRLRVLKLIRKTVNSKLLKDEIKEIKKFIKVLEAKIILKKYCIFIEDEKLEEMYQKLLEVVIECINKPYIKRVEYLTKETLSNISLFKISNENFVLELNNYLFELITQFNRKIINKKEENIDPKQCFKVLGEIPCSIIIAGAGSGKSNMFMDSIVKK